MTALNAKQLAFVDAYFGDAHRCAKRAYAIAYGVKDGTAYSAGPRLLNKPYIQAEIDRRMAEIAERVGITADEVVLEITRLAKADPRDLFEYRRGACRYCYGAGHLYQRTPRELREALAFYATTPEGKRDPAGLLFDPQGGVGFNPNREPHPGCPECFGMGEGYEYIKDSRTVPAGAARLFAGLQRTKDGVKIMTRSQDKALELAAKLHKLLGEKPPEDTNDMPPAATVTYAAVDASKAPE